MNALDLPALIEKASTLESKGRSDQACRVYAQWLHARMRQGTSKDPACAVVWFNLGVLRSRLGRLVEAEAAYRQALRLRPDLSAARVNLGLALEHQGKNVEALHIWQQGLPDKQGQVALLNHCGRMMERAGMYARAEEALRESLSLDPKQADVVQHWVHLRAKQCKWPVVMPVVDATGQFARTEADVVRDAGPFASLALTDDPEVLTANAARWLQSRGFAVKPMRTIRETAATVPVAAAQMLTRKLRVGFASADLHHHATGMLLVEVLERLDRTRFESLAFSWGPDDGTSLRARLKACFAQWHEIKLLDDDTVAALVQQEQVDIWVDLKGLTQDARPALFARRIAPIQVNYLGFPGSVPLAEMDYCITDNVIAPPPLRLHYAESVLCLPNAYQPNDRQRQTAAEVPSRLALGLPEQGFVFCSFNSNYKITPEVFAAWMRLLLRCTGSVLWLIRSHDEAEQQLRSQARLHGVAPERLVFSPVVHIAEHLARHAHADLFLDTFPCTAHTTASDALWAGLPVLTRTGRSFASRVAASLLHAVGLPALVTHSLEQYEERAWQLAQNRHELLALRQHLQQQRLHCPLFDTERYTRHLEDAFALMWLRHEQGQAPADIEVPARD